MWKVILPFIIIFALILVGPLLPKTNCSVDWLDSRLQRSDGPFLQCPKQLDERRIGLANFSRIGADVYRVTRSEYTEPAGFPCMIGAACLPIPTGRRTWKKIEFIRLDGPVVFERLQPYMDGNYMSDGDALFTDYKRVDSTQAPIDPTRLRSLPCVPYDTGAPCGAYSTDGRYVLEGRTVVHGADPASFTDDLPALEQEGYHLQPAPFARDRTSVFAYGERIDGADPATFGVLRKSNGIIGFDKHRAWRDGSDELEQLDLTSDQLQQLRADLDSARAAKETRIASSKGNGKSSGSCVVSSQRQQPDGSCVQSAGDAR